MDLNKIRETLLLDKGEEIVGNLPSRAYWKTVMQGSQKVLTAYNDNGVLVLTNSRLIFLQETGVFSKELKTLFTIPLKEIINVSAGGTMTKHLNVNTERGGDIQPFKFEGKEAEQFLKKIVEQRSNLKEKEVVTANKVIIEEKPEEAPMEVLKRKLAEGEITIEEFHKRVQRM